ncbi:beta-lactamase [Penicillium capsulatum]|uniref:Beta-lactamase n=1 Tax=Penicillium capsulatum TaxID=69766 RepID=A0A9W9LL79_9EURO|nr:beta-lactamase [Penicillium capsulatum]
MIPLTAIDPTSLIGYVLRASLVYPTLPNKPVLRSSENGALGGFSNARTLARIGPVISLDGTVDERQYLTPESVDEMSREQIRGFDPCLNGKVRMALGLGLPWSEGTFPSILNEDDISYWSGYGGSVLIMDRRRRMTISYVMNKLKLRPAAANSNYDLYFPETYRGFEAYTKASS